MNRKIKKFLFIQNAIQKRNLGTQSPAPLKYYQSKSKNAKKIKHSKQTVGKESMSASKNIHTCFKKESELSHFNVKIDGTKGLRLPDQFDSFLKKTIQLEKNWIKPKINTEAKLCFANTCENTTKKQIYL